MKTKSGLTLIELLLALTLSLLILTGVGSVILFSQKILSQQMGLIHIQENMRVLVSMLTHDLQNCTYVKKEVNYFVEPTSRKNKDGTVIYALYKQLKQHAKQEIMEGVEALKIDQDSPDNKTILGMSITFTLRDHHWKKRGYSYVSVRHCFDHDANHSANSNTAGFVFTK